MSRKWRRFDAFARYSISPSVRFHDSPQKGISMTALTWNVHHGDCRDYLATLAAGMPDSSRANREEYDDGQLSLFDLLD